IIEKFIFLKKIQNGILYGFRRSPRGGAVKVQLEEVSKLIGSIELIEEQDKWVWNLKGDGVFKVASARRFRDEGLSEMEGVQTRWVKLVPIKVNVLAWRLALNKLPTRFNMSGRVCPVCNVGAEMVDHLFFSCSVASSIMAKVLGWWGFLESGISSYHGWVSWFEGLRLQKVAKDYLEATIFISWFMNYLEEQTDGEAMINSIKNGDQPLPRVTQVSIARTSSNEQPFLKDKSMWSDQEKKIQKIDRLARSLLIQRLPNDIYSLIDSNKTAKDLWDALARYMLGSEYGEQDRKAAVLYEYETFKSTE
nr:RNA-directed DNA polymerase, eukaryota [Tanacetum cinerariifolium]